MKGLNVDDVGVALAPRMDKYTVPNGPMMVELRTVRKGLNELGGGIIRFDEGGRTDPWKLPYEEVLFVVQGVLRLHVGSDCVVARPKDVVTIARGATVVYDGEPGTEAFYALTPADWYKHHPDGL